MSLRTLYLQPSPPLADEGGPVGGKLREAFRARSNTFLTGRRILPEGSGENIRALSARDVLLPESVEEFHPSLIYIEGGLFGDDRGNWKIHWPVVEGLVERGAVLIVADCGTGELCRHRRSYNHAARFLRARLEMPAGSGGQSGQFPDSDTKDRTILCRTDLMAASPWLRPAFSGIAEIAVRNPGRLNSWENVAASAASAAVGEIPLRDGGENHDDDPWVFASVGQCAFGFVALIAAEVSADDLICRFPSNASWVTNLSDLLVAEAARNSARQAPPIGSRLGFFLSHRSVNKQLAVRVGEALRKFGTQVWCGTDHSVPADSLIHETSRGMEKMTHFVLFWSRACLGAPWVERELKVAVSIAVERRLPVLVVRLDATPVPSVIADAFRLEGLGMSPQELAANLIAAAQRLERNAT
jgi:TIR domain